MKDHSLLIADDLMFPFVKQLDPKTVEILKDTPIDVISYEGREKFVLPSIPCESVYDVLCLKWETIRSRRRFGEAA